MDAELDINLFLSVALPALHSDEGPPFARDPRLRETGDFDESEALRRLLRHN